MLKKSLILILCLQLNGCSIQGSDIKPTNLPTPKISASAPIITSSPTPAATPLPEKYKDYEILSPGVLCEPKSTIKAEIKYPYKIAVSKYGDTVYFINGNCKSTLEYPIYQSNFCKEPPTSNPRIINRTAINKISKDKTIDIVRLNNDPVMSCSLNGEIQVDGDNNLYFSDNSENIYKLSIDNNLTKLANVKDEKGCRDPASVHIDPVTGDYAPCPDEYFSGPQNMYLYEESLYFYLQLSLSPEPLIIKKMDKGGNISKVGLVSSDNYTRVPPFAIYKDKYYKLNYNLFDISGKRIAYLVIFEEPLSGDNSYNKLILDPQLINYYNDFFSIIFPDQIITKFRINSKGELFFNDLLHHIIWKIIPGNSLSDSKVIKFAGSGKAGFKDGKGEEAEFNYPLAMDFDDLDNLYVSDSMNNAIRKITPDSVVSTFYVNKE